MLDPVIPLHWLSGRSAHLCSEQIVTQSAMIKQVEDPELEEFRAFLKDLSPDDFRK